MSKDSNFILLEEISKNIDDLKLLLNLNSGIDSFKHDKIEEFEQLFLRPDLDIKIKEINASSQHKFFVNDNYTITERQKGIIMTSSHWPEGFGVQLASYKKDATDLFIAVYGNKSFPKANEVYNILLNKFYLRSKIDNILFYEPLSGRKSQDDFNLWIYFNEEYSSLAKNNIFLQLIVDINSKKTDKLYVSDLSNTYINSLINFTLVSDKIFNEYIDTIN
jgi:hypothetical protein